MQTFIGTKVIRALPMTRLEYNNFRGWDLPSDENGDDAGYLVEYQDGGPANTAQYAGYVSWSPERVFEQSYQATDRMTFGDAIVMLKLGYKVARKGWNGKGMWLLLVQGTSNVVPTTDSAYNKAGLTSEIQILPHIDMYTVDASGRRAMLPGWVASQTDMLSEDWTLIE